MALDTQEKRMNVLGVGRPWARSKFPTSDLDEQWRVASGHGYGGNALSKPAPISSLVNFVATIVVDLNNTSDVVVDLNNTSDIEI